ncbi:MAG: hypothetical protein BJ554DRAFT_1610 [Olpidium bornovanus]|uniref:Uncharacterized protein n=1 Tax=Olpidium bornovanus TaxID=278681 RepID=A0A8H8DH31_9FUNG|nr:MAG: hypothetical protein BJ554DRAFT_1610 [Olpidium bornovanus]
MHRYLMPIGKLQRTPMPEQDWQNWNGAKVIVFHALAYMKNLRGTLQGLTFCFSHAYFQSILLLTRYELPAVAEQAQVRRVPSGVPLPPHPASTTSGTRRFARLALAALRSPATPTAFHLRPRTTPWPCAARLSRRLSRPPPSPQAPKITGKKPVKVEVPETNLRSASAPLAPVETRTPGAFPSNNTPSLNVFKLYPEAGETSSFSLQDQRDDQCLREHRQDGDGVPTTSPEQMKAFLAGTTSAGAASTATASIQPEINLRPARSSSATKDNNVTDTHKSKSAKANEGMREDGGPGRFGGVSGGGSYGPSAPSLPEPHDYVSVDDHGEMLIEPSPCAPEHQPAFTEYAYAPSPMQFPARKPFPYGCAPRRPPALSDGGSPSSSSSSSHHASHRYGRPGRRLRDKSRSRSEAPSHRLNCGPRKPCKPDKSQQRPRAPRTPSAGSVAASTTSIARRTTTRTEREIIKAMYSALPKYDGTGGGTMFKRYVERHDEYFAVLGDEVSDTMKLIVAGQHLQKAAAKEWDTSN